MGSTKPDEGIPPKAIAIIGTTSVPKPFIPVLAIPIITAHKMETAQIEIVILADGLKKKHLFRMMLRKR